MNGSGLLMGYVRLLEGTLQGKCEANPEHHIALPPLDEPLCMPQTDELK